MSTEIDPRQVSLVQGTWRSVLTIGDTFTELFYGKLFSLDPSLRPLFKGSMKEQGRNLTAMLSVAVGGLACPEKILLAVRQLGRRHAAYGVRPSHYEAVRAALVWALERCFGDAFTPEARAAWLAAYAFLASAMQDATASAAATPASAARAP